MLEHVVLKHRVPSKALVVVLEDYKKAINRVIDVVNELHPGVQSTANKQLGTLVSTCLWKTANSGHDMYFDDGNISIGPWVVNRPEKLYVSGAININMATGDPLLHFSLDGTKTYTIGIDDSINNSFAIGIGASLGAALILGVDHTRGNAFLGYNAGYSREGTTPFLTKSVGVGESALYYSTGETPYGNVAIGYNAGQANTSGANNVYIGYESGSRNANNMAGNANVFIGSFTGYQALTSAVSNVGIGYSALRLLTTGDYNAVVGELAMGTITTGSYNTAIGKETCYSLQTGNSNVALGSFAGFWETGSDHLWIDNRTRTSLVDGQGKALMYGTFADAIANQYLYINGNLSTPLTITSTLATGTAPFTIASTTVSANLNADLLDGHHASDFLASGATSFIDLDDVPASYSGAGGKIVKVKADASGLEFEAGGAGVTDFVDLGDVPASYVDQAGLFVRVNATEDGLEYAAGGGGGGAPTDADYIVETANAGLSAEVVLGTTVVTTAAVASKQAAAKSGRLFLPNNGFFIERDSGSAWKPWGPIFPMTPIVSGDFSWVNQGTASIDETYGGVYLLALAASGDSIKALTKSKTGTYSIICCLIPHIASANYANCGLAWRQSSDGKLVTFGFSSSESTLRVIKWTNATTYSDVYATPFTITNIMSGPLWLKIQDEGTNRKCFWSTDSRHWLQVHSVGRTDFLTADEVGFYVNAANATWNAGATFLSWEETA